MPDGQITHTYTRAVLYDKGSGDTFRKTITTSITAGQEMRVDEIVGDGITDGHLQHFHMGDSNSEKVLVMIADGPLTIEVNDGTTPAQTIELDNGVPFVWFTDGFLAWPFSSDITDLYVTNDSGDDVRMQIIALVDTTVTFL